MLTRFKFSYGRELPLLFGSLVFLLAYQNCSGQFFSGSANAVGLQSTLDLRAADQAVFNDLTNSSDLVYWSADGVQKISATPFFGDSFSVVAVVPRSVSGSIIDINSGDGVESAQLNMTSSNISASHINDPTRSAVVTATLNTANRYSVLAAQYGTGAKELRLIVDGVAVTLNGQVTGIPVDFAYVEKFFKITSGVTEALIFKRKLSSFELASLSRQIGFNRDFPFVKYDSTITADTDINLTLESAEFKAARSVLLANACFTCHASWANYGELDFVAASLVVSKNEKQSVLWTRLSSSPDAGASGQLKNMPLSLPALSATDLQTLKTWILALP